MGGLRALWGPLEEGKQTRGPRSLSVAVQIVYYILL